MKTFRFAKLAVAALAAMCVSTRAHTQDVAFLYRMGAGFPGDINRTNPFSAVPRLANVSVQAPRAFGDALLINTADSSVRGVIAGDGSVTPAPIYGVLVRPYPTQQQSGGPNATIGAGAPGAGVCDALRQGFIMVKLPAGATVVAGGQAYVWCAATSGSNIQGAFVAAASGTSTLTVTNARYTGPADANGNVELEIWPLA